MQFAPRINWRAAQIVDKVYIIYKLHYCYINFVRVAKLQLYAAAVYKCTRRGLL